MIGIATMYASRDFRKTRKKLKQPFILDKTGIAELIRHRGYRILRRDLNGDLYRRSTVKGAQVAHQQPADSCQKG